jgi:hypothetical protein
VCGCGTNKKHTLGRELSTFSSFSPCFTFQSSHSDYKIKVVKSLLQERGLYLDDDLDHDEEIKYSAVRRDTDSSKFKSFSNVSSTTNHVDTLAKTGNIDRKDSLARSSTMVMTLHLIVFPVPCSIIKYSFKYFHSPICFFGVGFLHVRVKTSARKFHNNQYLCNAVHYGLGLKVTAYILKQTWSWNVGLPFSRAFN